LARELLRSRGPGVLTLNGVSYVDKPPLLYVLLGGAFALAGPSETTARAVPALCALAAIAATAWLGAKLLGARGGFVAGTALLTSAGFFAFARYVRPETLFVAALAWGFALVLTGLAEERRWRVAAGLAAFGVAALAKDPLGVIGPPAAIGLALALAGRQRPLRRWLPWPGVVGALGLGFGWWVFAGLGVLRRPPHRRRSRRRLRCPRARLRAFLGERRKALPRVGPGRHGHRHAQERGGWPGGAAAVVRGVPTAPRRLRPRLRRGRS